MRIYYWGRMKSPVAPAAAPRRGRRPVYVPTPKDRSAVSLMVVAGIDQDIIASVMRFKTTKALRRHFREELDVSYAKVKAEIAGKLIGAARGGDIFAMVFYLKTHGWSERIPVADGGVDEVDLTKLSDGEIAARLARLRRGPVAVRSG